MSSIPLEVDERIIELLAEDDKDYSAIKSCSLVCRTFLPLCRKHIFASIVLNQDSSPTTRQLERLLSQSPEIAHYIRKLDYEIARDDMASPLIHECLKRISWLRSLSVRSRTGYFNWKRNDLRPVLLHLLHLPTLTNFEAYALDKFLPSDLTPCINLKKLVIGRNTTGAAIYNFSETLPDHSIRLNELVVGVRTSRAIINICKAQRPDGQPVIDFSSLAKITVIISYRDDLKASEDLFKSCTQLTNVYISVDYCASVCPSLSEMLRPSMQTLTRLDITTEINDLDLDPLTTRIHPELETMRNHNIIETIAIRLRVQTNEDFTQGDGWGRFDEVLTGSGWNVLREVSVTVDRVRYKFASQMLPETKFPRLSMSESVLFKFEVNTTV